MTTAGADDPVDGPADEEPVGEPAVDDLRAAVGEVVASLKKLIDATERLVADPDTFAGVIDNGRTVVSAFLEGFAATAHDAPSPGDPADEADDGGTDEA